MKNINSTNHVFIIVLLFSLLSFGVHADINEPALILQQEWDQANFGISDKKQKADALKALAEQSRIAAARYPEDAYAQIWTGIILSTYAGEAGISALSLVKEAKKYFESAIALDPAALNGAAYTSLGSLYYQVPGWPLGFGDDKKAAELLKKGLTLDPQGIDANYFYADYLLSQEQYREAVKHFEIVLGAAPRPGRDLADKGRKLQAQEALEKIHKKLD